jgi:hypothetical protein
MARIEFWNEEKINLERIRHFSKQGYRIVCDSKGKVVDDRDKLCILLDPSHNPKRVNELCEEVSADSVIYVLMTKRDFLIRFPYQKFKLPLKEDQCE